MIMSEDGTIKGIVNSVKTEAFDLIKRHPNPRSCSVANLPGSPQRIIDSSFDISAHLWQSSSWPFTRMKDLFAKYIFVKYV